MFFDGYPCRPDHAFCQGWKTYFLRKPIDTSVSRINEAPKVVEQADVKLQVGFVRRFDRNHKKVHDCGFWTIGQSNVVKVTSRDPDHPPMEYVKVSGGIFLDMTIHDFDSALSVGQ